MVEDYAPKIVDQSKLNAFKNKLGNKDYQEGIDYQALLNINKRRRMYNEMISKTTKNYFS